MADRPSQGIGAGGVGEAGSNVGEVDPGVGAELAPDTGGADAIDVTAAPAGGAGAGNAVGGTGEEDAAAGGGFGTAAGGADTGGLGNAGTPGTGTIGRGVAADEAEDGGTTSAVGDDYGSSSGSGAR